MGHFYISQYDQNIGNAVERSAPSGPQKHITKESGWFHRDTGFEVLDFRTSGHF